MLICCLLTYVVLWRVLAEIIVCLVALLIDGLRLGVRTRRRIEYAPWTVRPRRLYLPVAELCRWRHHAAIRVIIAALRATPQPRQVEVELVLR